MASTLAMCVACDRQSANSGATAAPSTAATTPGVVHTESQDEADASANIQRPIELFFLTVNEYRTTGSWTFLTRFSEAYAWKPVPDRYKAITNTSVSYAEMANEHSPILIGATPEDNSCGVAWMGTLDLAKCKERLHDAMNLHELVTLHDLGQSTIMYAAALDSERLGLVSITWGTQAMTEGVCSISFIHWEQAIERVPKLDKVFDDMGAPRPH